MDCSSTTTVWINSFSQRSNHCSLESFMTCFEYQYVAVASRCYFFHKRVSGRGANTIKNVPACVMNTTMINIPVHMSNIPKNSATCSWFVFQVLKAPIIFYRYFTENNQRSSQWFHSWPLKVRALKHLLETLDGLSRGIYRLQHIVLNRAVLPEPQVILLNFISKCLKDWLQSLLFICQCVDLRMNSMVFISFTKEKKTRISQLKRSSIQMICLRFFFGVH